MSENDENPNQIEMVHVPSFYGIGASDIKIERDDGMDYDIFGASEMNEIPLISVKCEVNAESDSDNNVSTELGEWSNQPLPKCEFDTYEDYQFEEGEIPPPPPGEHFLTIGSSSVQGPKKLKQPKKSAKEKRKYKSLLFY